MITQAGQEGFRWFFGSVEDDLDPLMLGRLKVRIFNEHDATITTANLPWSHVMLPTTSGSHEGLGDTPNIYKNSLVVGFYIDSNEKQLMMIIGVLPVIPGMNDDQHSLSYLARGKQTLTKTLLGPEPASPYAAQYPNNRVITTRAGHVIELDDTPEAERVQIYHKAGSYIEIGPDGTIVIKSVKDKYDIVAGDSNQFVSGSINIQSDSSLNIVSSNSISIAAAANVSISSGGTLALRGQNATLITSGSDVTISAPGGVGMPFGGLTTQGELASAVGMTGSFTTPSGKVVHVSSGLITNID